LPNINVVELFFLCNFHFGKSSSFSTKFKEKSLILLGIGHFQVHSSFKFYLSNHCSNEKVPETKVEDLKILNNFRIQKFFI